MEAFLKFREVLYKLIGGVASLGGYNLFSHDNRLSVLNIIVLATGTSCPFIYIWTIATCNDDLRFSAIAYFGSGIQVTIT